MKDFFEKQQIVKLIARLYYSALIVLIVGGILWINQIGYATLTISIGASMMGVYFVIQFINLPLPVMNDWSLVFPELSGLGKGDPDKK